MDDDDEYSRIWERQRGLNNLNWKKKCMNLGFTRIMLRSGTERMSRFAKVKLFSYFDSRKQISDFQSHTRISYLTFYAPSTQRI
jgi:hypothetical protein